ncbi:MAG TPA: nucleoside-diphosphate sugar epimerase/dehydratase, partial [Bryobacteraceae bacterium]|nr:nucleoside-diphosphate sugar epimerase/dehydratase [Bryobacteraceae bacterium]
MTSGIYALLRAAACYSHFVLVPLALALAFLLRFDLTIPPTETQNFRYGLIICVVVKGLVFSLARLHNVVWRFVGMEDLFRLFVTAVAGSVVFTVTTLAVLGTTVSRSVYILDLVLCFGGLACVRAMGRKIAEHRRQRSNHQRLKQILIYGAGQAGRTLAREIMSNPSLGYRVVGFVDDSPNRRNMRIEGLRVLGSGRRVPHIVDRLRKRNANVSEIVIAMPSATGREMQEALANCRASGVTVKTVPGLGEILSGKILTAQIRDISVTDLLGREPVQLEETRVRQELCGRRVMVTGAAGSIGSELCRQIAAMQPALLVAFDQAESELFRIENELRGSFPSLHLVAVLGDIRERDRVDDTIRSYRIESIFHAAAYKHVPMMEAHPLEAARNNVIGTRNLVESAWQNKVSSFLMISSDKAVNPTSVMGASKRFDEMMLSSMPKNGTRYVSVRFGNVLGSNGSVVPTFKAQIAAGGPVTVTHPEMRRYFMTIREAVQLVLIASTMGKGSEVFVLDMGEPVRIVDLARQMIRLAGKVPDEEIQIQFTGLRSGEKLYEELSTDDEQFLPTTHKKIRVLKARPVHRSEVSQWLAELELVVERRDNAGVVQLLRKVIPE